MDQHHLLLISGSLREASSNSAAVATAATLAPEGVETVVFDDMDRLPHFNPDHDVEPLAPTVVELRAAIAEADAVVFCTPEYAGALPGSFKNLLDWTVGGTEPTGTRAAWIDVSAPGRGVAAHESLRSVLLYTDFTIVDEACVRVPLSRDMIGPDGRVADAGARAQIAAALETVLAAVPEPATVTPIR